MCDIFLGNLVLVLANGGEQPVIFFTITNCSSVRIQRYYLLKIALPLVESFFSLNKPHNTVRISVDIEEKYKTTVLGDHRQEKKSENNLHSPRWIVTSTRVALLNSTRPVGL